MFTLWSWGSIRSGLFAQWCVYTLVSVRAHVPVCVCVCVFSVRVKGHCVGGHQELCE